MRRLEDLALDNRWRRRDPREKLLLGGGLLLLAVVLPPWPGAALVLAAALGAALAGARLPPRDYARVLAVPAAFLLTGSGALAIVVDPAAAPPWLTVTPASLVAAAEVALRALAATSAMLLVTLTTPLPDLLALLRRALLPAPIVDLLQLVYRFVALALSEASVARAAQTARLGYAGPRRALHSTALLAAGLLPRTLDRAQRLQTGLACRGWTGDLRLLAGERRLDGRFVAWSLIVMAAVVAAAVLAGLAPAGP